MRRILYVLIGVLLLLPAQVRANDWTTRGGDLNRTHLSTATFGAVDISNHLWQDPVQIGATGAQPLVVGEKIYQLGGQRLWEIDARTGESRILADQMGWLSDGTWRPSTSSIAYGRVDGEPRLYFGSGSNSLCVINPERPEQQRCHRLHPDAGGSNRVPTPSTEGPIVTTPLVMYGSVDGRQTDFVAMGDKQGRVWVFQGFGAFGKPYQWTYERRDGWVLASMVEVSEQQLTFVWGNTNGDIYAHQVTPGQSGLPPSLTEVWDVHTNGQIADGFAKARTPDGENVYALDSIGNLLQIRASTGEAQTLHLDNVHFTNMSPAIDDQNIYLSIRETKQGGPGALVAVDRSTFQERWRSPLPAKANTNPLVLPKANTILIGDTLGALHAFAIDTGKPTKIFEGDTPLYELAGLPAPLDPLGQSYQTLTGLSETILAGDPPMLITGISGAYQGQPDGYLFAYRTLPAFDVGWVETELDPPTGQAHLRLDRGEAAVAVEYAFYWQAEGAPEPTKWGEKRSITLKPSQSQAVTFTPPNGPGKLIGVVNPLSLIKDGHRLTPMLQRETWAQPKGQVEPPGASENNIITGEVTGAPDLAVSLQASPTYDCLATKTATVTFQSAALTAVKATVQVRLGATSLLSGTLNLSPGATSKSLTLAGIPCGSAATLEATIAHQDPALKEPDLTNNQASTTVQIGGAQSASGGGPTVVMLPEDCQVNPDWTSSYPCLNYPGLYVP